MLRLKITWAPMEPGAAAGSWGTEAEGPLPCCGGQMRPVLPVGTHLHAVAGPPHLGERVHTGICSLTEHGCGHFPIKVDPAEPLAMLHWG